jgi:hypothetical protein
MGVRTPETCWAVHTSKRQVINLRNCCICLVDLFVTYDDTRTCKLHIFVGIRNRSFWNFKPDVTRLCVCVCVCVCVRHRERESRRLFLLAMKVTICFPCFPRTNIIKSIQHINYVKNAAGLGRQCLRSSCQPSHCIDTDFDIKETFSTSSLSRIALSAGRACVDSCRQFLPLNVTAGCKA